MEKAMESLGPSFHVITYDIVTRWVFLFFCDLNAGHLNSGGELAGVEKREYLHFFLIYLGAWNACC